MIIEEILQGVIDEYNICSGIERKLNLSTDRAFLMRQLSKTLYRMNRIGIWDAAIQPFELVVPANKDYVSVLTYQIFKPVYCLTVIGATEKPLDFLELTDFKEKAALYANATTDDPDYYSLGANRIYIGPGKMSANTAIKGEVRRLLTPNDVDYLPGDMIVSDVLRIILPKGTPAQIAAWSNWKESRADVAADANKKTGESRTVRACDPIVKRNNDYGNYINRN